MDSQKEIETGTKILLSLHAMSSVLKLYDSNNSAVVRQIDSMLQNLEEFFEEGSSLRITLREDEFFINDKLLKVDLALYLRAKDIAETMSLFKYSDIRFDKQMTRADLESFVSDFSESLRTSVSAMKPSYGAINGKMAVGSSAAAFRFEPDKLAIWLYSGLLEVVESLYEKHSAGESPSLVPIRRSLQLIIDNMSEHNGIYQMLSAIVDPNQPRSQANTRVAIAIDCIGFGRFIGLPAQNIMNMALCSIMGGLSQSTDPIKSVAPLFQFQGLGDSALGLILTLHDARAARKGRPTDIAGKVLMVVEDYHDQIDQQPDLPLPEVIHKMASGEVGGLDKNIGGLFARYKGIYPIGSLLLVGKMKVVVMGHTDNDNGKMRPLVSHLAASGRLSDYYDLSQRKDMQISGVLSMKKERITLSDL